MRDSAGLSPDFAGPCTAPKCRNDPDLQVLVRGLRGAVVLPPSLFEHPSAELSVDDSAQLSEDRGQPDHVAYRRRGVGRARTRRSERMSAEFRPRRLPFRAGHSALPRDGRRAKPTWPAEPCGSTCPAAAPAREGEIDAPQLTLGSVASPVLLAQFRSRPSLAPDIGSASAKATARDSGADVSDSPSSRPARAWDVTVRRPGRGQVTRSGSGRRR